MKLIKCLSKFKIKSLYIKWILMFTGLIFLAEIFTFIFAAHFLIPEIVTNLDQKLYRKAEFVQKLYNQRFYITDEILDEVGSEYKSKYFC